MVIDLSLILVMGVFYAVGVYLMLDRTMTRVLLGLMLMTNATNILILHAGGLVGKAPLYDKSLAPEDYSDPLPQALVLTSIVISFAVTALVLGMIYRSWTLSRGDQILDDAEDQKVATRPAFDSEEDAVAGIDPSEFDGNEEARKKDFETFTEKKKAAEARVAAREAEAQDAGAQETEENDQQEGARS